MSSPTPEQLERLVTLSESREELDGRVTSQYGSEHVNTARLIAAHQNGFRWVFGNMEEPTTDTSKLIRRALKRLSTAVLAICVLLSVLLILWPPFYMFVQGGFTHHTGFHWIFSPSDDGRSVGAVNTTLLLIELIALAASGFVAFIVAQRIERGVGLLTTNPFK